MDKRNMRRWARRQMSPDTPPALPRWAAWSILGAVVLIVALKLLGIV